MAHVGPDTRMKASGLSSEVGLRVSSGSIGGFDSKQSEPSGIGSEHGGCPEDSTRLDSSATADLDSSAVGEELGTSKGAGGLSRILQG